MVLAATQAYAVAITSAAVSRTFALALLWHQGELSAVTQTCLPLSTPAGVTTATVLPLAISRSQASDPPVHCA